MERKLLIQSIQVDDINFIDEAFNGHITGTISIDFETCGDFSDMLDEKGKLDKKNFIDYLLKAKEIKI